MSATIDRRELMAALGSAAVAWPMTAHAQQRMPVVGMVMVNLKLSEWFLTGVRQGLAELGYVEGKDYRFEFRETNYQPIYRIMCQELIDQKVTLLLVGSTAALQLA